MLTTTVGVVYDYFYVMHTIIRVCQSTSYDNLLLQKNNNITYLNTLNNIGNIFKLFKVFETSIMSLVKLYYTQKQYCMKHFKKIQNRGFGSKI